MKYITFDDFAMLRGSALKLCQADLQKMDYTTHYHDNLKDPVLAVLVEKDCFVNNDFFVLTNDQYIINDIGYRERVPAENNFFGDEVINNTTIDVGFLLGGDSNYYHWVINWLPRLFLYESLGLDCPILVNKKFGKMQENVLAKLFPWATEKVVKLSSNVKVSNLYIPNFFLNPLHSPFAIGRLRSRVFGGYYNDLCIPKYSKNIYISRKNANTRKITNELELLDGLSKFDYEVLELEKMDWLNQVNAFFHAKCIISPHGAGLTNLIFTTKNPKVLEIINEHYTKVFWSLGYLCGVKNYDVFKATPIQDTHDVPIHKDMKLDLVNLFLSQKRIFTT